MTTTSPRAGEKQDRLHMAADFLLTIVLLAVDAVTCDTGAGEDGEALQTTTR
jgi:hypothetical protein